MNTNTRLTQTFIGSMLLAAIGSTVYAGLHSHTLHTQYALAILVVAAATSRMKVKLPGITGNMSVNLPFLLMAVVNLSSMEAIAIACASTVVQCWPKRNGEFKAERMLFNVSMMALATSVASLIWNAGWLGHSASSEPVMLALATTTFFLGQTAPVAGIIKITEGVALHQIWLSIAQLSFPYFVISAGMTSIVNVVSHHMGWELALAVFPVMFCIHRSYRRYFETAVEAHRATPLARAASAGI